MKPLQQLIGDRLPRTRMVILGAEYTLTVADPESDPAQPSQELAHT
ncbi:hypothetical protein [Nocardia brasiliensis]|nr:hypothetical protein [Nocardia brasiliensis]